MLAVMRNVLSVGLVCMVVVVKMVVESDSGLNIVRPSVAVGSVAVAYVVSGSFALRSCSVLVRFGGFAVRVATLCGVYRVG